MRILALFAAMLLAGCPDSSTTINDQSGLSGDFIWNVRAGIPLPVEPLDNPMSEAKFQLGRHLFYDARLSGNATISCASCRSEERKTRS